MMMTVRRVTALSTSDRHSTKQVRSDEDTSCNAIKKIVEGQKTWLDIQEEVPEFTQQETD